MQRQDSWNLAFKAAASAAGGEDQLQEAKDMTATEFGVNLRAAVKDIKGLIEASGSTWEDFQPLWSWDNNRANVSLGPRRSAARGTSNKVLAGKFSPLPAGAPYDLNEHRVPCPPRSPDVHRPIEHVFNRLIHILYTEVFRGERQLDTPRAVAQFLVEQFYQISPASIAKDVEKLPVLLRWLVANDGAWAPRELR